MDMSSDSKRVGSSESPSVPPVAALEAALTTALQSAPGVLPGLEDFFGLLVESIRILGYGSAAAARDSAAAAIAMSEARTSAESAARSCAESARHAAEAARTAEPLVVKRAQDYEAPSQLATTEYGSIPESPARTPALDRHTNSASAEGLTGAMQCAQTLASELTALLDDPEVCAHTDCPLVLRQSGVWQRRLNAIARPGTVPRAVCPLLLPLHHDPPAASCRWCTPVPTRPSSNCVTGLRPTSRTISLRPLPGLKRPTDAAHAFQHC